eukprot:CAMPEP_0172528630 /NCGR_PEP_ID=MMETSP1067-20121228/2965_1 /TAXON_ID=265564 ORGANISM="Thalassiosira punctigera, Strain Tpunct2005C2" /NCGR_SAMPLE_ID=MMETSP1067 /ASSEMBLY_ACC=CAM_ASM_000444 /LENGTH=332 /DNA_ID=CAMNT_0013312575 /DNA_START=245 /DNA_END=1243 /DNA_ORIENTATION=-
MRSRRGRFLLPLVCVILQLAVIIIFNGLFSPIGDSNSIYCLADDSLEDDDDFLAEILAEQAREDEELSRIEAEAREFDAMRARQPSAGGGGGMPGGGGTKMGGPRGNMPKGARGASFSKLEEDLKKKEAESASKKTTQDEEEAAKDAERMRLKREAAFEAELEKMNEEQRKKAQRQKSIDAKVVKRILKAHKSGKHYAVLGIRNLEVQIGPFYVFNLSIGPFVLFRVKTKAIKRVYRNLARTVHPDKNKDGRAEEAFHALETSAAILTDENKRSDYDKRIISARRRRNKYAMEGVVGASQVAWKRSVSTLRLAKRVLGPFSTPILVIGALII